MEPTDRLNRDLVLFRIDPEKFDRAIETITGRQLSNRSTPRRVVNRPSPQVRSRHNVNDTFRRSMSMDDLRSRVPEDNVQRIEQRHPTILARTNSVNHIPERVSENICQRFQPFLLQPAVNSQ